MSLSQPSISVVIPLYNKGSVIIRTLSSVFAQKQAPHEIIVVDDESTDDGLEKVRSCKDPRIKIVKHERNMGPGAARNTGLRLAQGEYISFLDADDEWHPLFLQTAISCFERSCGSVGLVSTGHIWHPSGRLNNEGLINLKGEYEIRPSTPVAMISAFEKFISLCFTVIKTDIVRRWGGYFEGRCLLGEDQYLLLKLLLNERIFIIPEPYGIYHTENSSLFALTSATIPATEPCLSDPADLIAACPVLKRQLLFDFLAARALKRSYLLIKLGQRRTAMQLLKQHVGGVGRCRMKSVLLYLLAIFAPLLPLIRSLWRRIRRTTYLAVNALPPK